MAKFVTAHDQKWESSQRSGLIVEKCRLWEKEDAFAGIIKLPKGFHISRHTHHSRMQVFVLSGQVSVELDGEEPRSISGGGYYLVEQGDIHADAVEEDLTAFVVTTEFRECWNKAFA